MATRFDGVVRELGQATVNGMSTVAYDAYRKAEATLAAEQPACALRWELLAAIGKTESNHGVGRLDVFGNSLVPIIGIPIGGDTDGGALDGDASRDHAVGPMQFIPSTWRKWGTDANGDGKADPGNIVDAATAAGRYLCRAAGDLTLGTEAGVIRAILSYNPNQTYLRVVGARFEALASDLALGWFSAAALPPAPPPVADVAPNAGPDGREATGNGPTLTAPPATTVTEVRVFGAQDLTTSTTAPVTIEPGECAGPTLALDPRAGFLRCGPTGGALLDPCEVAPYDATLVGCLPDPTGTPVLLRAGRPGAHGPARGRAAVPAAGPGRRRSLPAHPGDRADPASAARSRRRPPRRRPADDEHRAADLGHRAHLDGTDDGDVHPGAASRVEHDHGDDRRRAAAAAATTAATSARDGRGDDDLGRAHGQGAQRRQGRRRPPPRRRPPRRRRPRPSRSPSGRPTRARAGRPSSGRRTARARPGWSSSASPVWPTASSSSSRPSADRRPTGDRRLDRHPLGDERAAGRPQAHEAGSEPVGGEAPERIDGQLGRRPPVRALEDQPGLVGRHHLTDDRPAVAVLGHLQLEEVLADGEAQRPDRRRPPDAGELLVVERRVVHQRGQLGVDRAPRPCCPGRRHHLGRHLVGLGQRPAQHLDQPVVPVLRSALGVHRSASFT